MDKNEEISSIRHRFFHFMVNCFISLFKTYLAIFNSLHHRLLSRRRHHPLQLSDVGQFM